MEYYSKIKEFSDKILEELGSSYKEHIYVNAMCIHLRNENYLFQTEVIVPINYKGVQLGYERADIIIYEPIKCILEFKAQTQSIAKKEIAQLTKYKKNLDINDGILINFGNLNGKLEYHEMFENCTYENSKKSITIE
uniref:GxxExxY protein n=1 Tax=viral metagenome TaxID=1070528 RepID=A0A6C0LH73_9ZZZZ